MQAPHEGLLQPNQRAPWPDLSAMGVAGELQIDAKKGGLVDGDGLMGQQHDGARPITPGEGERNVLPRTVLGKPCGSVIGNARQIETRLLGTDGDLLIAQDTQAHPLHLSHPAPSASGRVILVITGDEEDVVAGPEVAERSKGWS